MTSLSRRVAGHSLLAGGLLASVAAPIAAQTIPLSGLAAPQGCVVYGAETEDYFGLSVGGGADINGDGFSDLLVAAPTAEGLGNSTYQAGDALVLYGRASIGSTFDAGALGVSDGFMVHGIDASDRIGEGGIVGIGDHNGDGFDDFAFDAQRGDGPADAGYNIGEVYVVFGTAGGFPAHLDPAALDGTDGYTIFGTANFEIFGARLMPAGDLNGDGLADIAIGAPGASSYGGALPYAGRVFVVFGSSSPLPAALDSADIDGSNGFTVYGADEDDFLGFGAGAGDFNGDGLDDLLLAAPGAHQMPYGIDAKGSAYILFGQSTAWNAAHDLSTLPAANAVVIEGIDFGDGISPFPDAIGDFNGDGRSDILLTSYDDDAYVLFGTSSPGTVIDLATLDGTDGFVIPQQVAGDSFGWGASRAGDFNGDGFSDLLVSARFEWDELEAQVGASYLVFGSAGPHAASFDLSTLAPAQGRKFVGIDPGDTAGSRVASAGDFNGDGFDDIALASYQGAGPANTQTSRGEVYLVFGSGAAATATSAARCAPGNRPPVHFPGPRCRIDFDGGDNGSGGASLQTVTLTRSNASLSGGLSPANTANVVWEITTDRTAWTSAAVTFKYTDAEIAGLTEGNLRLYKAPSAAGPWTELATTIDSARNTATATVSSFSFFALSDQPGLPVEVDSFGVE